MNNQLMKCQLQRIIDESVNDDIPKCSCGGSIQVFARQTRKSDEGMTIYYKCDTCEFTRKK